MLNPKHKRYAERLRELIEEGQHIATLESGEPGYRYIRDEDEVTLWIPTLTVTSKLLWGE